LTWTSSDSCVGSTKDSSRFSKSLIVTSASGIHIHENARIANYQALREGVLSLPGRKVPYLIGSVDASLVWVADRLGNVQPLVESVRNWF
jgi:hypothetical protein